jgi:hypothetical protein
VPLLVKLGICELAAGALSGWAMIAMVDRPRRSSGSASVNSHASGRLCVQRQVDFHPSVGSDPTPKAAWEFRANPSWVA